MPLLLAHAAATCFLAGLVWVVQVVVYPSFLETGASPRWPAAHQAHSRRISAVVGPAWVVQAVTLAVLLVQHRQPAAMLAFASVCALATVGVTVLVSVPLHARLASYDDDVARRLIRTNWWRTAAWTGSAAAALAMLAVGPA